MMSRRCRQGPISQQIAGGSCVTELGHNHVEFCHMQFPGHLAVNTIGRAKGFIRRRSSDFYDLNATLHQISFHS